MLSVGYGGLGSRGRLQGVGALVCVCALRAQFERVVPEKHLWVFLKYCLALSLMDLI